MSQDEHVFGTLKPVEGINSSEKIEGFAKNRLDYPLGECYENLTEQLMDVYESYIVLDNQLYEYETKRKAEKYRTTLIFNDDGTIDFVSSFHNGGSCLAEEIGDAFAKERGY